MEEASRPLYEIVGMKPTGDVVGKRRVSHPESELQRACMKWMRLQYPKLMMFSVPNGGYRNRREAAIMVSEGIRTGVSDLILLKACGGYHGLCVEMKWANGRQSDAQKEFQFIVEQEGYLYRIARSFDAFKDLIERYVNGYITREGHQ